MKGDGGMMKRRETKERFSWGAGILSATYHFAVIIPDRGAQSATRAGNTCDRTVTILNRPIERKPGQLTEVTFELPEQSPYVNNQAAGKDTSKRSQPSLTHWRDIACV